jgi:GntR family transcriptional regulator
LLLKIREDLDIPIYMQIRNQIIHGIADGQLMPGDQLPTVRALALEIGINAMTVNKAYQQLKLEGYIRTDRRNGARVCELEGENNKLNRDQLRMLSQLIAEVKVMGISKEVFIQTCEQLYEGEK